MNDPLKARLDKLRKVSESTKRRANLYSDIAKMDDSHTARSLGSLQKASAPGKKLQKIGFLMLWVPEPTGVTCAIGGPMILAGRYLDKNTMAPQFMILAMPQKIPCHRLVILKHLLCNYLSF